MDIDPNATDERELSAAFDFIEVAVNNVIDALRDGRRPPISGEDGRAAVEMAEAAIRSAEWGQVVELPLRPTAR